ncbi:uncharacterized protein MJAP1_003092 [Malassezia japonica]|uniref:Clavaminate synthase-like protein n=1 Tax=Malassezia japonica TaxID=223818 RepID=A0AAF0JAR5_9BASI|nr:uncharacterized protein MJAP1_003092 [Malassezia japonica]WFD40107.1 hypothetical protein MJAP1_003092 [Malassezia japonica]
MSATSTVDIPPWVPPMETKNEDFDWAPLHTLDLSEIKGENFDEIPPKVVEQVGRAFSEDGFLYAINHGLPWEKVLRQFAIGQYAFDGVTDAEKKRCLADMLNAGSFVGYKPMGHWQINGVKDRIEQLNFGSQTFTPEKRARFPEQMQPLIDEIHEFANFNHDVILRKILNVLSLVLKLPVDTLWNLSKEPEKRGLDLLRYALYRPPPKEDDQAVSGVRLQGHTDFNSVSILWSQPITSLEVLMPDNKWRMVRYRPNAIVLNLGDAMHFLSGGYLKQTIHRVVAPPEDQAHYNRLGLFYFALFNDDVPLNPLLDSPVVREAYKGRNFFAEREAQGLPPPTAGDWERMRVRAYGQGNSKKGSDGHDHEKIGGVDVTLYNNTESKNNQSLAPAQRTVAAN